MASIKAMLGATVGRLLFRELTVTETRPVGTTFQRLVLAGESLCGAECRAGHKVQVMLPEGSRTYSPFAFDARGARLSLLVYLHGREPGASWARSATVGQRVRVFGPRGSLPLGTTTGPVVLFGDETSFGVSRALCESRAGASRDVAFVFEVGAREESERVLAELGVAAPRLVPREAGRSHLAAVEGQVRDALSSLPGATLVLTGNAASVQALRAAIKAGLAPGPAQKVKAYWAAGKRGLD